jgi:simple sugar transport system substrate-binding protein
VISADEYWYSYLVGKRVEFEHDLPNDSDGSTQRSSKANDNAVKLSSKYFRKWRKIMKRFLKILLVTAVLFVLSVAVASAQDARPYRIVVVTHGQASDPFWSVVKNGFDQAAADMRVEVEYQAPATFDMVAMSQLIDAAVASQPDGLVVSIPDADALGDSIAAAVDAGIPVISINSGSDVAQAMGILAHIGQTEYEAGFGGGQRMAEAGATNALCVNQEVGNVGLDLRCQGFTDAMAEAGGTVEVLAVDLNDPTGAQNRISAAMTADDTINAIFTLGPTGAAPALAALEDGGMLGETLLATFDLSPEVLEAVRDGNMLFAIDQQQYTQGYLAVVYMTLYLENLNTPGQFIVPTGPGFVTADTAAQVIELSAAGTR